MATIGLDSLFYSKITEDSSGNETYGNPISLAKAMTAELSVELAEATLFADDGASEIVKEFKNGTISLGINDIGITAAQDLTGAKIDDNHAVISTSDDSPSPVAIGFRAKKSNGKYRYFWIYRVKFGIPGASLQTKGDSISFSTPTIEGTVMRRNKVDGFNNHPWKTEVNEDDASVPLAIISNWFSSVYEPAFSVTITVQPIENTQVIEGNIGGELSVTAQATSSGTLSYQWYSNTVHSNTGGTAVSGEIASAMDIPTSLEHGVHYYYCAVTASGHTINSNVATVIVVPVS